MDRQLFKIFIFTFIVGGVLGECNTKNAFQCDGNCFHVRNWCNGNQDCTDNRDEADCGVGRACLPEAEFRCGSGECLRRIYSCDGVRHCNDGSDETQCATDCDMHFRCDNDKCAAISHRCNGWDYCGDNSDEENCEECHENQYLCLNGSFVPYYQVCDTIIGDCGDGSDELDCEYFPDPLRMCRPDWSQWGDAREVNVEEVTECPSVETGCTTFNITQLTITLDAAAAVELMRKNRTGGIIETLNENIATAGQVVFQDVAAFSIDINIKWPGVAGTYTLLPFTTFYHEEGCEAAACEIIE